MKRSIALLLLLALCMGLAACGQSAAPAPEKDALVVDTCILMEADDAMINNYSLLAVNPDAPFADADGNAVHSLFHFNKIP